MLQWQYNRFRKFYNNLFIYLQFNNICETMLVISSLISFTVCLNIFFQLLKEQHISGTAFIANVILKMILHFLSSLLRNDTLKLLWNVVSRLYVVFIVLLLVSCLLDLSLAQNECIDKLFAHIQTLILMYFNRPYEIFMKKFYRLSNEDPTEFYMKIHNQNLANE